MEIKIKKLHENAIVPTYGSKDAACFDLYAVEDTCIIPGQTKILSTGLAFEVPDGYCMKIYPRSGISARTTLIMPNSCGIIDADYRGEVRVILRNIGQMTSVGGDECIGLDGNDYELSNQELKEFHSQYGMPLNTVIVRKGDRIAQAMIEKVIQNEFVLADELSNTQRGAGGLGSSGIR